MTTNYSTDDIETKIMSILYANIDKKFSQFALFSKLINDKFTEFTNKPIHPTIKAKFLLVLRTLASRYDDIIVSKENNIYYVVCLTNKDELNKVSNYTDTEEFGQFTNFTNLANSANLANPTEKDLINYDDLLNYIIDNNLSEDINYVDPFDGNTIFHDLVITSNVQKITKLIVDGKFDFFVKNKQNKTPIELATNKTVENYLISKMIDKYLFDTLKSKSKIESDKKTIEDLTAKVAFSQSLFFKEDIIVKTSFLDILLIKFINFYEDNVLGFLGFFVVIIAFIAFKIIY